MRVIMVGTLLALAAAGCGLANSRYVKTNYRIGDTVEATIGAPLIALEQGVKNNVYGNVLQSNEQHARRGGSHEEGWRGNHDWQVIR